MIVSLFENLKDPSVFKNDTIDSVIEKIKGGYTDIKVLKARSYGKGTREFDKIKEQIPCFSPNASFSNKRCLDNLVDLSGFIYIDFDQFDNPKNIIECPAIYSCWKSVSATGLGALVKVNNLTRNNFNSTWSYINTYFEQFDISLDPRCKDITRQNVISYDPDIYINKDCIAFEAVNCTDIPVSFSEQKVSTLSYDFSVDKSSKYDYSITIKNYTDKLFYKSILEDYYGEEYRVIKEGREYRDTYLPKYINDGDRHKWISGFITSILFLNKDISKERLLSEVHRVNTLHCLPCLDSHEVYNLVTFYYDLHRNQRIKYRPKMKKIWFNPEIKLSLFEKRAVIGKESGKLRREKTISALKSIYDELKIDNQRVTQKMIEKHELCPCKLRTIKKYWNDISN